MPYPKAEYPLNREYECDGSHSSRNAKDQAEVWVEICADPCCAKVFAGCLHKKNEWDPKGLVLSCTFCGQDGT